MIGMKVIEIFNSVYDATTWIEHHALENDLFIRAELAKTNDGRFRVGLHLYEEEQLDMFD